MEKQLESGIWIEESQQSPDSAPLSYRCIVCGKPSSHTGPLLFWETADGFEVCKPGCRCGRFIHCKECPEPRECPKCGTSEFLC